jgi:hypothetical protein
MDRSAWMYGGQETLEYRNGVGEFIECAKENIYEVEGYRETPMPLS